MPTGAVGSPTLDTHACPPGVLPCVLAPPSLHHLSPACPPTMAVRILNSSVTPVSVHCLSTARHVPATLWASPSHRPPGTGHHFLPAFWLPLSYLQQLEGFFKATHL